MVGMLAAAKAGHDKDTLYIIIEETDEYVWLTDGKYRPVAKPKKKNKKHIQIWKKENEALKELRQKKKGIKLCAGMTLAIEPMINIGRSDVEWLDDDWTVVTEDGTYSAHYENTIAITPDGEPEILTLL